MSDHYDEMRALAQIARLARVENALLMECLQRELIRLEPPLTEQRINEAVYAAQRVRRLMALGVNLEGVEVAFHMRRQLLALQTEMEALHERLRQMEAAHAQEVARLLQELSIDA